MARLYVNAPDMNAAARRSHAKLRLGIPEPGKSESTLMKPIQMAKEVRNGLSDSRPIHDLSTAKVLDLIEKRLKWIHRTDLRVGRIHWHEDNSYAIELIKADRRPVYFVHVDAGEGRFFWSEATED